LDWANNGSTNSSAKPFILHGFLRGSSGAFVSGKFIMTAPGYKIDPANPPAFATSMSERFQTVWVWNAAYAASLHEDETLTPGPRSQQDGSAGAKWAEKHLEADKKAWLQVVTTEFLKETGLK
jgi:hypothetical protein